MGKGFDTNAGLNLYDYHARQYEPAIGRFTAIDPLAEKYYSISPYAYVGNSPTCYIDPDGRLRVDSKGKPIFTRTAKASQPFIQYFSDDRSYVDGTSSARFIERVFEIGVIYANDGSEIVTYRMRTVKYYTSKYNWVDGQRLPYGKKAMYLNLKKGAIQQKTVMGILLFQTISIP